MLNINFFMTMFLTKVSGSGLKTSKQTIVLSLLMPNGNKMNCTAKISTLAADLPLPTGIHRPSEFLTGSSFSMSNLMRAKGKNACGIQWQSS